MNPYENNTKWSATGVVLPCCNMCNEVPAGGIRDGIRIKKVFICTQCEQKMIHSPVGSLYYQVWLEKTKQILKKLPLPVHTSD